MNGNQCREGIDASIWSEERGSGKLLKCLLKSGGRPVTNMDSGDFCTGCKNIQDFLQNISSHQTLQLSKEAPGSFLCVCVKTSGVWKTVWNPCLPVFHKSCFCSPPSATGLTVSDLVQGKGTVTKRVKMLIRQHRWPQADALTPLSPDYRVAWWMTFQGGSGYPCRLVNLRWTGTIAAD